ncbi:MAG: hypothetical protein JXB34_01550 [Bacteroidales bacterium]|nr:hypothetical protein [Bacteroidales bacterium]
MIDELKNIGLLTPIFTIIGVLIGSFLTFLTSWILKSKESKLKISSQLIEKRIEAHEKILSLAKSMRTTISTDKLSVNGEAITYPILFSTKESYSNWNSSFSIITNEHSHWLGREVTRELYFIHDYIFNLNKRLETAPDNNYIPIGIILRYDFIDMATNIEKSVLRFFDKGWRSFKIKDDKGRHKYPKKVSLDRLNKTNLFKRHLELHKYLGKEEKSFPKTDIKKHTELFNIAPNGLKIDIISLKEVPNIDNSGVDYEITFNENEDYGKPFVFGHCDLISGKIRFDKFDKDAKIFGVDFSAMRLLVNWIEENIEEIDYGSETIEYD